MADSAYGALQEVLERLLACIGRTIKTTEIYHEEFLGGCMAQAVLLQREQREEFGDLRLLVSGFGPNQFRSQPMTQISIVATDISEQKAAEILAILLRKD